MSKIVDNAKDLDNFRAYTQNGVNVIVDSTGKHSAVIHRGFGYGSYPACEIKKTFWRPIRFHMPATNFKMTIQGNHRGMAGTSGYHEYYELEGRVTGDQVGFRIKNETGTSSYIQILTASKTGTMPGNGSQAWVVLQEIGNGYNNVDLCFAVTPACGSSRDYTLTFEWYGNDDDFTMLNYAYNGPDNDSSLSNGPNIIGATD